MANKVYVILDKDEKIAAGGFFTDPVLARKYADYKGGSIVCELSRIAAKGTKKLLREYEKAGEKDA